MTSQRRTNLAAAALLALSLGTAAAAAPPSTADHSQRPWNRRMQQLYALVSQLLTDTSSDARFDDPANAKRIEGAARKLSELAHDLTDPKVTPKPDADPTLGILAGMFSEETQRAYRELKRGHRAYARDLLNNITGYCISCHTRNSQGPNFASLPLQPAAGSLGAYERGRFFTATRQYDRALQELGAAIEDPAPSLTREQSVRYALAIAVRVKGDPQLAASLLQKTIDNKSTAYFLREEARTWLKTVQDWQRETPRQTATAEGLHAEALRLVAAAHELQKYPQDHSGDVLYLRASAVIHELLAQNPPSPAAEEAYLMAGLCYEVLRPLDIGDMHEVYYEACVRRAPHSGNAEACYRRYEESVYAGYTGSAGSNLPSDIRNKLSELEALAHPAVVIRN